MSNTPERSTVSNPAVMPDRMRVGLARVPASGNTELRTSVSLLADTGTSGRNPSQAGMTVDD